MTQWQNWFSSNKMEWYLPVYFHYLVYKLPKPFPPFQFPLRLYYAHALYPYDGFLPLPYMHLLSFPPTMSSTPDTCMDKHGTHGTHGTWPGGEGGVVGPSCRRWTTTISWYFHMCCLRKSLVRLLDPRENLIFWCKFTAGSKWKKKMWKRRQISDVTRQLFIKGPLTRSRF